VVITFRASWFNLEEKYVNDLLSILLLREVPYGDRGAAL